MGDLRAHVVDRPTRLFYIWIYLFVCKYTNLRNTAGQSARKHALMAKVKIGLKPPISNNGMTATEPCWTCEGGVLRRWKFSDNFLRPSCHHPLWHVTRLTLDVVELSKWRNIWEVGLLPTTTIKGHISWLHLLNASIPYMPHIIMSKCFEIRQKILTVWKKCSKFKMHRKKT